jgi:hypothetical protein
MACIELAADGAEGIVERLHEHPAHGIDDQRPRAALGIDQGGAAAGGVARKIQRSNQTRRALDEHQRLFLIPGVVTERHRIGAGVDEIVVDGFGNAKTTGGVLAIDDDQIELPVADGAGQMLEDGGASGLADHVADEKNAQPNRSGNRWSDLPLAHNPA